eukprot:TRINITY_DN33900_c0_g1_i1.p1 TRINITY_DN33900_c0_g1~~TRINITY_DN33900_c0_g1_i1.p1  ORF type:complete len:641 (-),score=104.69 TRINITY_DN33900_c0_g1_i1:206-2095(-)
MSAASPDEGSQPRRPRPVSLTSESELPPQPPGVTVSPRSRLLSNGFAVSPRLTKGWNTFMKPDSPCGPSPSLNVLDEVDTTYRKEEFAVILQGFDKLGAQMDKCLEAIDRVCDPMKRRFSTGLSEDGRGTVQTDRNAATELTVFSSRMDLRAVVSANVGNSRPGRRAVRPNLDVKKAYAGFLRMNTSEVWNNDAAGVWVHSHRFGWLLDVLDAPHSSLAAYLFSSFRVFLVVFSLMTLVLQSTDEPAIDTRVAAVLETLVDVAFLVELILHVLAMPMKLDILRNPMYWPDVLVPFGLVVRASCGFDLALSGVSNAAIAQQDFARILLLCFLPVLRTLKLLRHFETYHLMVNAFKRSLAALPVLLYTLGLLVLSASAIVYWIEPRDNVTSLPHAMWFCIVTMSTVGYGDVSPITSGGQLFVSVLVIIGLLFTAMPIGIVGHEFMTSWASRHRVMLINRTKKCLTKWGYNANDFEGLFQAMDANQDGKLDLPEFVRLMGKLNIGLNDETAVELFLLFDEDASGTLDFDEFIKQIYPFEYFAGMHKRKNDACHACNNVLLPDAKFCRKCGTSRKGKCPNCDSVLARDAEFCRMCGAFAKDPVDSPGPIGSARSSASHCSPRVSMVTMDDARQ